MKKITLYLLLLINCSLLYSQNYINEIIVKPAVSTTDAEYQSLWFPSTSPYGAEGIEIYNPHCSTLNISNWILTLNGSSNENKGILRFPNGTTITSGGRIIIGGPGTAINNIGSDVSISVPASNTFAYYRANGYLNTGSTGRLFLDNPRGYVALYTDNGTPVDCVFWLGTCSGESSSKWADVVGTDCWDDVIGLGQGPATSITNIPQGDYGSLVSASTLPTPGSASLNSVRRYAGNNITNINAASIQNIGDGQSTCQRVENITFGSSNAGTAITCITLPIELISFNGEVYPDYNLIKWVTVNENNNDYFTLEYSHDGLNFSELSKIDGAGISNRILNYSVTDYQPIEVTYYRLKQTDFDGNNHISKIIAITKNNNGKDLKVVRVTNLMGQDVSENYTGIRVYYFNDGSVVKKYDILNY